MFIPSYPDENPMQRQTPLENSKTKPSEENSTANAKLLADKLRFRLKEASAQRGGSEAFLHWIRSDSKKEA
jgi:hypothetical protein